MNTPRFLFIPAALAVLLSAAGCFSRVKSSSQADAAGAALDRRELADATVSHWSNLPALTAKRLMEEYGVPDEVHADHLVWIGNGPWRRTVVVNDRSGIGMDDADQGVVVQSVDYRLTPEQAARVASFDDHVAFNPRSGELSARSGREEYNILRLNLADDVIHGRQSPEQARDSYASIVSFEQSGKTSPYLLGLRFVPDPGAP